MDGGIKISLSFAVLLLLAAECVTAQSRPEERPPAATSQARTPPLDTLCLGALAQEIKNPVSTHYMLPIHNNFEWGDVDNQFRYNLRLEPVVPFLIGDKMKLITRAVILVYADQYNGMQGPGPSGLGDISLQIMLAPQKKIHGLVLAGGIALDLPTAIPKALGAGKWTVGPSALIYKTMGGWGLGFLTNQVWSYAGPGPQRVSYLYLDPWINYTFKNGFGFDLESETVLDWVSGHNLVPLRFGVTQLFLINKKLPVSLELDGLYYPVRPDNAAKWGVSLVVNFVFERTVYRK